MPTELQDMTDITLKMAVTQAKRDARSEPWVVKYLIIGFALAFLSIFIVLPLVVVFTEALWRGFGAYIKALTDPEAWSAIQLTLTVAAISVSLNLVFGVAAAWAIA